MEGLCWRDMGETLRGKQHSTAGMGLEDLKQGTLYVPASHFSICEMDSIKMSHSKRYMNGNETRLASNRPDIWLH